MNMATNTNGAGSMVADPEEVEPMMVVTTRGGRIKVYDRAAGSTLGPETIALWARSNLQYAAAYDHKDVDGRYFHVPGSMRLGPSPGAVIQLVLVDREQELLGGKL
jgi:hypothetical protein